MLRTVVINTQVMKGLLRASINVSHFETDLLISDMILK